MTGREVLHIRLVAPSIWESRVQTAFAALDALGQRTAHAVLRMMHGRHIGITPQLVCELVPAILAPDPYLGTRRGAWPAVFGRLVDEAIAAAEAQPMDNSLRPERRFGLLLSAHPAYSLLRLALPVVQEACCRL